jgi:hypothetical protein
MKSTKQLQQQYEVLLELVKRGKDELALMSAHEYPVDELEQFANLGYVDEFGEDLYKIFMYQRKRKLDKQFVFNQDNIKAIICIDHLLKNCCEQLKANVESEFIRLLELKKVNKGLFTPHIEGYININAGDLILENTLAFIENLLYFSFVIFEDDDFNRIQKLSLFDLDTNYASEIGTGKLQLKTDETGNKSLFNGFDRISNKELDGQHIGYAFYKLYLESYLSLKDIIEIVGIEGEMRTRNRYKIYEKKSLPQEK